MSDFRMAAPGLADIEIRGMTRQTFVARAALAAGAVYGSAAIGPFVRSALAQEDKDEGRGDVSILNFALTLEFLEAEFYRQALDKVPNLSRETKQLTEEIRVNEVEHVAALRIVIRDVGGQPVSEPEVDFGDAFRNEENYLDLAETFEDTGVSAYNGAAPMIQSKEVLATAGTIVQIEGRHAALIRLLRGHEISPGGALDNVASMDEVNQAVRPFFVGG